MIHLPHARRGRIEVRFPANSSHMCYVELVTAQRSHLGIKGSLGYEFSPFVDLWLCHDNEPQLGRKSCPWLRACVRYWPGCGLVYVCPVLQDCTIFMVIFAYAIKFISINFSMIFKLLLFITFQNKLNSARV